jgi:short-subunit dehydrogenase involved in D-alanine esterification of teichoic acids
MKLHSRNILITGGSSGIGLELARALAVDNSLVIAGRNRARLEHAVSAEPRLRPIELDVVGTRNYLRPRTLVKQPFREPFFQPFFYWCVAGRASRARKLAEQPL